MSSLCIINENDINKYDKKNIIKVMETFSMLNGYYSSIDKLEILRSLYVKMGNVYKIYNCKKEISKEGYMNNLKLLNLAYDNSKMSDEDFRQYLKPMAMSKTYYDENKELKDELSAKDIYFLFGQKVSKYNSLDDYYKSIAYTYGANVIPAWTTLGYVVSNKHVKTLKR